VKILILGLIIFALGFLTYQDDVSAQPKQSALEASQIFRSTEDWLFSMILPSGLDVQAKFPFYFANANTTGNKIVVDYAPSKQRFADKDGFHMYLKSTEMNQAGFSLGNSMTTVNTDYGYKTVIELKLKMQNGNSMMMRKDFHFINKENTIYSVYGYSHDAESFKSLKKTLNTFKPVI
jgi:hypothetical protein